MSENMQQNERGEWEPAEPLPFLGVGIDWEIYDDSLPLRAVGYIGHEKVAEVKARSRNMLTLKMFAAGLPYRKAPQSTPPAVATEDNGGGR